MSIEIKKEAKPKRLSQRILGGTINYGLGSIVPRIVSFFLIPLYTQYLNPSDYGIIEFCGTIGLVIMTFMRFGVPGSVSRFYFDHKDNPEELKDYVTTVHKFLVFASIITGGILGVIFFYFGEYITPGILFFPFIVIVLINSTFSANSDLQRRLLQSKEESRYSAILNIFNAFFGIVLALVFVIGFKLGAFGIMLSQLVTTAIFFVQAQFYLKSYLVGKFRLSMLKSSLVYGLNSLPHHLFVLFAPLLSKLILIHTNSLTALGIFSLANRFVQPLQLIYLAFNQAYTPIYYSLRTDGVSKETLQMYMKIIWVGAAIMFMGIFYLIPPLIPIITPPKFHESASLVPILAVGFIWQILYFLTVIDLFYTKKNKYIPLITLGGFVINVIITIFTVTKFGSQSLAWAQLGGYFMWAMLAKYFVDKHGEIKLSKGLVWQTLALTLLVLGLDYAGLNFNMLLLRTLTFTVISAFLVYTIILRNPAILSALKNLDLLKRKQNSNLPEIDSME